MHPDVHMVCFLPHGKDDLSEDEWEEFEDEAKDQMNYF